MKIEVILTPAELPALKQRDLRETACVVFDVLRATSTFVTALHNGANAIMPVGEISEAVALRQKQPDVLLGGERDGLKIRAAQTSGTDFDFGNSPREYMSEKVRGKTIVSTTTNGTRALRACAGAKTVLAAAFLNLSATAKFLRQLSPAQLALVCAGTRENTALEDVLAAGALCEILCAPLTPSLSPLGRGEEEIRLSDSAEIALRVYRQAKPDLAAAVQTSENARRLLSITELRDDVPFCLQYNRFPLVVKRVDDGTTFASA
ncbi:MAG TPA: 2-phosphosulfolactate phosphatase [Alphaproteobacteria bacterium]|nr:2-phosphosulfolactate phosphatase [Alphaproteobacteria bacterium]